MAEGKMEVRRQRLLACEICGHLDLQGYGARALAWTWGGCSEVLVLGYQLCGISFADGGTQRTHLYLLRPFCQLRSKRFRTGTQHMTLTRWSFQYHLCKLLGVCTGEWVQAGALSFSPPTAFLSMTSESGFPFLSNRFKATAGSCCNSEMM